MSIVDLLSRLRAEQIQIWAEQGKLQFRSAKGDLPADLRAELRARKADLLAFLGQATAAREDGPPQFVPTQAGEIYPLSFSQSRMWFLQELHPRSAAYNIYCVARFHGEIDFRALDTAVTAVVNRHDSLRVTFAHANGGPVQTIGSPRLTALTLTDLTGLDPATQAREVDRLTRANIAAPFDLATGPLFRIDLLRLTDREHVWIENFHHIVVDDWSMKVFTREWMTLYAAARRGTHTALPPLPVQYPQYCAWQHTRLAGERLERQVRYWKTQLAGDLPVLQLPTDRPRGATQTFAGRHRRYLLPPDLHARAAAWSDRRGGTLFMTLFAAYAVMLQAWSRQSDIAVGVPIAGRTRTEAELLIGCCIGMIVLRADLSGQPTGAELVARIQALCKGAYDHQEVPFERLIDELKIPRDPRRNAVFQTIFTLQNTPLAWTHESDALRITIEEIDNHTSKMDVCLTLMPMAEGLGGLVEYNADLFDPETIDSMFETFVRAVEGMVDTPDAPIASLLLVGRRERELLSRWARAAEGEPTAVETLLHAAFEQCAASTPDRLAVMPAGGGDGTLSYAQLDAEAARLAARLAPHLSTMEIARDAVVAIFLDRSPAFIVALFAVLKAGAAFVALETTAPADRLAYVLEDSGAVLVLTTTTLDAALPAARVPRVHLDADAAGTDTAADTDGGRSIAASGSASVTTTVSASAPASAAAAAREAEEAIADSVDHGAARSTVRSAGPEDLACIVYTSGSTGRPKGVALPHRALASYVRAAVDTYRMTPDDRTLQFASLSVDPILEEIFPVLSIGGAVVLRAPDAHDSFERLISQCERDGVTMMSPPTGYFGHLVSDLAARGRMLPDCLRVVIIGGDAANADTLPAWACIRGRADLVNSYGPTEASVVVTTWTLRAQDACARDLLPIGRALLHAELHVLNDALAPVPIGAPGELYIGGPCLARGYLGRPDLTAERFLTHPERPAERLYRTGDVVRYRRDGEIEFLGRADNQVKVRGYRVDPGEIERLLEQHPGVTEAAVLARERAGEKELIAYVAMAPAHSPEPSLSASGSSAGAQRPASPESTPSEAEPMAAALRAFLTARVPAFMVPAAIAIVPALPRLASGKIDRRALPLDVPLPADAARQATRARTPTEAAIAAIWADVLRRPEVSVTDDFFDLGGHSLLMTRILSRVREACGIDLPLADFFDAPTIERMSEAVDQRRADSRAAAPDPPHAPRSRAAGADAGAAPDLQAEARLDPAIVPAAPWTPATDARDILLTGVTGFVGAFLLRELLARTGARIHCLVRAASAREAFARIAETLASYGITELSDPAVAERIVAVPGDLAAPRLGLSREAFDALAACVGSIYHNGAWVNFLYPYRTLQPANVRGTQEVLRLAVAGRTKRVHFVSSTSAAPERAGEMPRLATGYDQSKWVAEALVAEAGARGVPVTVFRPASIAGDSRTGASSAADFFHRFVRGCVLLGASPRVDTRLDLIPVDLVCRDIVMQARDAASIGRTYHLVCERPCPMIEFMAHVRALGFAVADEPYAAWRRRLGALHEAHPLAAIAAMFPEEARDAADPAPAPASAPADPVNGPRSAAGADVSETPQTAQAAGLARDLPGGELPGVTYIRYPPVTAALVRTYLDYLSRHGLLDLPADGPAVAPSVIPTDGIAQATAPPAAAHPAAHASARAEASAGVHASLPAAP